MHDPHVPPTHHVHETAPLHDPVDSWHDHSHDEKPQHAHGDVQDSNLVLGVGVALAAVIAVSCLVVYGFYTHYNTQRGIDSELVKYPNSPATLTREAKVADLFLLEKGGTTKMPTEKEGVTKDITITPIDQAMDTIVQKYAPRKTAQGN